MKRSLIISAVLVLAAFLLLMFGFNASTEEPPEAPRALLMVVEKDTGAFLMQLRQGVQTAATEMGWELQTEVASDAAALNLNPAGRTFNGALLLMENDGLRHQVEEHIAAWGIDAVLVGAEEPQHACVGADLNQAAELAGSFAAAYDTVYLLGGSEAQRTAAMAQLADVRILTELPVDPDVPNACVVALDEDMTRLLGREKAENRWQCDFICWNPEEEARAAWLEEGIAQAMVVPSPYAMGYQAAMLAMGQGSEACRMPCHLVTREEMYSAQNIKLVFPLLH